MKFFVSYQYSYPHYQSNFENRQIDLINLPTYTDLQKLQKDIAEEKKKPTAGTPTVVILGCHLIAG